MNAEWKYQLRIGLSESAAALGRNDPGNSALAPLTSVLQAHNATLQCQYDAFAGYVMEAEQADPADYPLYKWTKATIEDAEKRDKYLKSFALRVDGQEVYDKRVADALEAELQPFVGGEIVTTMSKFDSNPASNPQMPEKYRS